MLLASLYSAFCNAKLYILAIPYIVSMTGIGMNQAVLAANGGRFPVMLNERAQKLLEADIETGFVNHVPMTDATHLNFMADFINFHTSILSPGDLLIALGDKLAEYTFIVWMTIAVLELNRKPAVNPIK